MHSYIRSAISLPMLSNSWLCCRHKKHNRRQKCTIMQKNTQLYTLGHLSAYAVEKPSFRFEKFVAPYYGTFENNYMHFVQTQIHNPVKQVTFCRNLSRVDVVLFYCCDQRYAHFLRRPLILRRGHRDVCYRMISFYHGGVSALKYSICLVPIFYVHSKLVSSKNVDQDAYSSFGTLSRQTCRTQGAFIASTLA